MSHLLHHQEPRIARRFARDLPQANAAVLRDLFSDDQVVRGRKWKGLAGSLAERDLAAIPMANDPRIVNFGRSQDAQSATLHFVLEVFLREVRIFFEKLGIPMIAIVFAQNEFG